MHPFLPFSNSPQKRRNWWAIVQPDLTEAGLQKSQYFFHRSYLRWSASFYYIKSLLFNQWRPIHSQFWRSKITISTCILKCTESKDCEAQHNVIPLEHRWASRLPHGVISWSLPMVFRCSVWRSTCIVIIHWNNYPLGKGRSGPQQWVPQ